MSLDRSIEPDFKTIENIEYIKAKKKELDNGIPLYTIHAGVQEVLRIDFVFNAGEWNQSFPLVAEYTMNMLQEGSQNYSSEEIADKLDYMGAYLYCNSTKHTSTITVYTLSKHLVDVLGYIEEIIKRPVFPENKFSIYNGKKLQQYIVESQKVEVISQQHFAKALFGLNHPYGISPQQKSFENISINDLIEFHKIYLSSGNCKIIASGNIDDVVVGAINNYFGGNDWESSIKDIGLNWKKEPSRDFKQYIEKEDAVQSAIRIGKEMVTKYHDDYAGLQVLNTIFGGYFGSRLMQNIREDKGYTYGIGSGVISNIKAGYFVIVTQVRKDVCADALKEIYIELDKLQSELISDQELSLVKSYMMGSILRNFDGAFALSDSLKTILEYNLDYNYYDNFIDVVKNITSVDLQALAISYFKDQNLYEIVAG